MSTQNNYVALSATVWLANLDSIGEDRLIRFLPAIGRDEKDRYERFQRKERQLQFLLGRIMLRIALSRLLGIGTADIGVTERRGNAPLLDFPDAVAEAGAAIGFSISHSGRWVGCAVCADTPLGLDIETGGGQRNYPEIARAAFDAGEYRWLQSMPEDGRKAAFYWLWTRKEAFFKMVSAQQGPGAASPWNTNVLDPLVPGRHFRTLPDSGLFVSLCSREPVGEVRRENLVAADLDASFQESEGALRKAPSPPNGSGCR